MNLTSDDMVTIHTVNGEQLQGEVVTLQGWCVVAR